MSALFRLAQRASREDDGMTLAEMVVGMLIMSIFMAVFTGVIIAMSSTTNDVQAVTTSASDVNSAFITLDKIVRYADAITTVGQGASGDWYVELDSVDGSTDVETCRQLRVDRTTRQLQQRTWTATGATTFTDLTDWTMLAGDITNGTAASGSADQPFAVPTALTAAASSYQRLTVTVVATATGAGSATTRSQMTFTALNSTASAATNSVKCQQPGVGRP
jgi:prepilin-type N-terminal cleavage/methylation domain-containing protein